MDQRGPGRQLLWLLSGLALAFSCASPADQVDRKAPVEEQPAQTASPHQPLLLALQAEIEEGEEAAAERLIERLESLELDQRERQVVDSFQRILKGRKLVRGLRMELFLREGERAGERKLHLLLSTEGREDLTLLFPPITLEYARLSLARSGEINRNLSSQLMHPLGEYELKAGEEYELFLGDCPILLQEGAISVRDAWRLSIRGGHIRTGEVSYPAERLPRPQVSVDTLVAELAGETEQPADFASFLGEVLANDGAGADVLLERAARLDTKRRRELLPLLAGALEDYSNPLRDKTGSLAAAVIPALRWISPGLNLDSSLAAWSNWTRDWVRRSEEKERNKNRSGLVLP